MENKHTKEGWKGFLDLCANVPDTEAFKKLFDLFLTIEEKENIASRYLIVKELLDGERTQREIAETFKTSIAQITRGSNALKIIPSELKQFLKSNCAKKK